VARYALIRHIDLWQAADANFDPDMAFRTQAMWRRPASLFLGVALARRSPFAAPLSGYRRSAGEPLSAFAALF
jgi:hypothetical protein